jgi:uncharacterized membrane protein
MANFSVYVGRVGGAAAPIIRRVEFRDVGEALAMGADDFRCMPSQLAFLALIYPLCGVVLTYTTSQQNAQQLLFPLLQVLH